MSLSANCVVNETVCHARVGYLRSRITFTEIKLRTEVVSNYALPVTSSPWLLPVTL